ncbi:diguanylate phosphodiesterase [Novimethylophilus kurashikiensis]|uniref:Diguanylate phosphodiesterase n=1 Tax=Novimethylophilus kurashikiensis TaxID=1825523 RepID=A0A2R5F3L1_9PROT|nr:HDOD domain-containing protein [Novimethylophilus kurashikiensis]GBG12895.1 diguanylate phosphodiesterase [Novimethylophilus kurashikiensis]
MNEMIKIALAPVIDSDGAWGGVWISGKPEDASLISTHAELLGIDVGGLRILLDLGAVPDALAQALPAERTLIVVKSADAAVPAGFAKAVEGRDFIPNVTSQGQWDEAAGKGAAWFSGPYIAHPPVVEGKKDSSRATLLKLLTLIAEDADGTEIENVFKREPELSFNLFRLVNSVSMGLKSKITTFNQAIMILGRRQMQRWIQLMLYTRHQQSTDVPNPLLQQAAMRARLMERFAAAMAWDAHRQEQAFMVGIFSLLDTLLGMSMPEILAIIKLPDEVQAALLGEPGELGDMLKLVVALQAGAQPIAVPDFLSLTAEQFADCQFDALKWAAGMSQEMG